jgi:methylated-DNA-[protein]-cysteine S-methyltransferase
LKIGSRTCGNFAILLAMTELAALKVIKSPVGNIAIGATPSGVAQLEILPAGSRRVEFSDSAKAHRFALDATDQIKEYFEGERQIFSVPITMTGTTFQLAVWVQLSKLQFGEQVTYAELASAIGNPKAVRAVGGAVGANPVPLLVGCHRVLGSQRRITGYSGGEGLVTKRWLLAFEQIEFRE